MTLATARMVPRAFFLNSISAFVGIPRTPWSVCVSVCVRERERERKREREREKERERRKTNDLGRGSMALRGDCTHEVIIIIIIIDFLFITLICNAET